MNQAMVDRWNDVVSDSDEVWIVGDLVMGDLGTNLRCHVSRLKGRKILVPGNHDVCWQHRSKGPRRVADYLDLGGIARIVNDPRPVMLAGQKVLINHFPVRAGPPIRHEVHAAPTRRQRRLAAARPHPREVAPVGSPDQCRGRCLEFRSGQRRDAQRDDRGGAGTRCMSERDVDLGQVTETATL